MNRKLGVIIISTLVIAAAAAIFIYQRTVFHSYKKLVREGITIEGKVTNISPLLPIRYYEGREQQFRLNIAYTDPFGFSRNLEETIHFDNGTQKLKEQASVTIYFLHRDGNTRAASAYNTFVRRILSSPT